MTLKPIRDKKTRKTQAVRTARRNETRHEPKPVSKTEPAQEKVSRYSEMTRFEARYLFHGTSGDYEPSAVGIDPLMGELGTAYAKAAEKQLFDWHGVKSPAVWVSDRVGGARHYATDSRSSSKQGWVYVIDSKKLKDDRVYFGGSGGDYVDDEGDYHSHNEFAFAGKIPPEAIVDWADANSPHDVQRLVSEYENE